jgi:hypothetical protein
MQDVGPAVQTLGGLLKITDRETYVAISEIALKARVPERTAKNHLTTLDNRGWIQHCGRQHTRRGFLRRTATIKITKQTKDRMEPYGLLPWWACCSVSYQANVRVGRSKSYRPGIVVGRLPWCCKAVLLVVMARLCSLKAAVQQQDEVGDQTLVCEWQDDFRDRLDNMGGDDRFRFSLDWLTERTGLHRESVIQAKRLLNHRFGILKWVGTKPTPGVNTESHLLVPNWEFRVVVKPAGEGRCTLAFDRGSENGP